MKKESLRGLRYVNLLRCSTFDQDTSIADQRVVNNSFAAQCGMIHVFDKESEGVSGSKTFNRKDLAELIARRKTEVHFDAVLVHDLSRLTRGGIAHGHEISRRLSKVGVIVVSVNDNLPDGDEAELIESVAHYRNKKFSKGLSEATTRGLYESLIKGDRPASAHTPFGFNRQYEARDGTPTLILQPIGGGARELLDPNTGRRRAILTKNGDGQSNHFLKQRDETSRLIAGDPARVETVRWMFRQHYVLGWGMGRIIAQLNKSGVAPPIAKLWNATTVQRILTNSIYLGHPIAGQSAKGLFHKLSDGRPTPVEVNQGMMEEKELLSLPAIKRPKGEWIKPAPADGVAHPQLITDSEVIALAWTKINGKWENWDNPNSTPTCFGKYDRHANSSYILKGLLRSKQNDYKMSGRTTGNPKKFRYYRAGKMAQYGLQGTVYAKHIPAEPIEQTVLELLVRTLADKKDIGRLIEGHVKEQSGALTSDHSERARLKAEESKLIKRLKLIYENGDGDEEELRGMILEAKSRLQEVRQSLTSIGDAKSLHGVDIESVKTSVVAQLSQLHTNIDGMPLESVRRLIASLFSELIVDLATRDLEVEIRLPSWALTSSKAIREAMCLEQPSCSKPLFQAQRGNGVFLAKYQCIFQQNQKKPRQCYECTRSSQTSVNRVGLAAYACTMIEEGRHEQPSRRISTATPEDDAGPHEAAAERKFAK